MLAAVAGAVASLVALLLLPWPLWGRLALLVAVIGVSAIVVVLKPRSTSSRDGRTADLTGRQVVKVASQSRLVMIAELRPDQQVVEHRSPLSWADVSEERAIEPGRWFQQGTVLQIIVRGYNLEVRPTDFGIWEGTECYGEGSEEFLAAVLDPTPVRGGKPWVGLKLAKNGARRIVMAGPDGRLTERDPFDGHPRASGHWHIDADGRLHIEVEERWYLTARRWGDIYLGSEIGESEPQDFAVVRVAQGR